MQSKSCKEHELNSISDILFRYILPFVKESYIVKERKKPEKTKEIIILSQLEQKVKESFKTKKDDKNFRIKRTINNVEGDFWEEKNISEIIEKEDEKTIDYSLELRDQKENNDEYETQISYEETGSEEKLSIRLIPKDYEIEQNDLLPQPKGWGIYATA